jgi:hypothetical protein
MYSLIKRQTADYSDGEAILTLLKYDRTELFVPKVMGLTLEFARAAANWARRRLDRQLATGATFQERRRFRASRSLRRDARGPSNSVEWGKLMQPSCRS